MSLRFTTAGESHGPGLTAVLEGLPAGLELEPADLDRDLARRQLGHGRGGRMKIESDRAEVTAGIRHGRTLGGPIAIRIANRDYANWEERMNPWPVAAQVEEILAVVLLKLFQRLAGHTTERLQRVGPCLESADVPVEGRGAE